jgi:hypothetical protein
MTTHDDEISIRCKIVIPTKIAWNHGMSFKMKQKREKEWVRWEKVWESVWFFWLSLESNTLISLTFRQYLLFAILLCLSIRFELVLNDVKFTQVIIIKLNCALNFACWCLNISQTEKFWIFPPTSLPSNDWSFERLLD